MKNILLLAGLLMIGIISKGQNVQLTQSVKGIVVDEQSGHQLKNVTVSVDGFNIHVISDSTGSFKLPGIPLGRQTIFASITGYEPVTIRNLELTSSKEVVIEIRMKEKINKMEEIVITTGKQKYRALNELAVVSARQLSMDEAVRYAGTRNDPSRMAQNFAGVSGTNDARNDIIIRGNSPGGVLWRMDGIDIPNPNHYSTLGSTGGPVTILNTNTLKNSDFMTSAFPAQYGNALAGVFDLRMKNGNADKYEFLGQLGFNGFEFGAEGPINKKTRSSFLLNYRYSMVPVIQAVGLSVGTGSAVPYYQDAHFKFNIPTKKAGTFTWFGLGGESHIRFSPEASEKENLYASNDGSIRDRFYRSLTGVTGLSHQYFFNENSSGKFILAISGFQIKGYEDIIEEGKDPKPAFVIRDRQIRYTAGYSYNKKINSKNQFSSGITADFNKLALKQDLIRNGDSSLSTIVNSNEKATLLKIFSNLNHRFSDKLSSNLGVYYHLFTLNNSWNLEPRWNLKYQFKPNQSFSIGAGMHSQLQPLQVYFFRDKANNSIPNKELDLAKSIHTVAGYDINFSKQLRLKTELYAQFIYNAAVENIPSSFSMLNAGADFGYPNKTGLVNEGKGYNYGMELTVERFLHNGLYYLFTFSLFESKYKGSDDILRNTAFSANYVTNMLGGKEFRLSKRSSFIIDTKLAVAGGQRYVPFDLEASKTAGYVIYQEDKAFSMRNDPYIRWDLKFSYALNGRKTTQKWYIDFQNLTNRKNIYVRTLNPKTGKISEINQIGFFPNVNYVITF